MRLVRVMVGANRGVISQGDAKFIGYCGRNVRPASGATMIVRGWDGRGRRSEIGRSLGYFQLGVQQSKAWLRRRERRPSKSKSR